MVTLYKNGNILHTNALRVFFFFLSVLWASLNFNSNQKKWDLEGKERGGKIGGGSEHTSAGYPVPTGPSVTGTWGTLLKKGFLASCVLQRGIFLPRDPHPGGSLSVLIRC